MTTTTSRRAVLAGAATLPVLAAPVAFASVSSPDPIFAAIAHTRAMEAAYDAALTAIDDRGEDVEIPPIREVREALARTVPTTLEGLNAICNFVLEGKYDPDVPCYFETEDSTEMSDFIRSLAAATNALVAS